METNLQPHLAPETFNLVGMGQHELFKSAVLNHLREELGNEEWGRFRRISRRHSDYGKRLGQAIPPNITPEHLVESAVCEAGITVNEILGRHPYNKNATEIGYIDGMPVYYVQGHGIYFWGSDPDIAPILMLWATEPAYPPGW